MSVVTRARVDAYRRDGFVNAGRLLEDEEVRELAAALDDLIRRYEAGFRPGEPAPFLARDLNEVTGQGEGPVHQFVNMWHAGPVFRRLLHHPRIVAAAAELAGTDDLQVWCDQLQYKPSEIGGCTRWHQDAPYWTAITPAITLSAWVPLANADVENGCMWMVPGSHRWGPQVHRLHPLKIGEEVDDFARLAEHLPEHELPERVQAVPCPVALGEVHFHHCMTWHGSPRNRSPRSRPAVAVHYMPTGVVHTGKPFHPLDVLIKIPADSPMLEAGDQFPVVYRAGSSVPAPS
jgi:phytanoyl-CoA hydroxylase